MMYRRLLFLSIFIHSCHAFQIPSRLVSHRSGSVASYWNPKVQQQPPASQRLQTATTTSSTTSRTPLRTLLATANTEEEDNEQQQNEQNPPSENTAAKGPTLRSRFISNMLFNIWYVITIPFPDLRRVVLSNNRSEDGVAVSVRFREGLIGVMVYLAVGVLAYHRVFERWPIVDSLYFACVCFSTVGYGDLCPTTVPSKIFTCCFGFAGIALLGAAIGAIGSKLTEIEQEAIVKAKKTSRNKVLKLYDNMPKIAAMFRNRKKSNADKSEFLEKMEGTPQLKQQSASASVFTRIRKVVRLIAQSMFVVAAGGILIGKFEGWTIVDSIYYALITASTIGLGDFTPQTPRGRLAAIVFIPMAVASAGEILASIGLSIVERRQKKLFSDRLTKGLTTENLNLMDSNGDGHVDREEYVLFMLMEMGLVNKSEIEELFEQFKRLDVTKSGTIDQEDLRVMAMLRQKNVEI